MSLGPCAKAPDGSDIICVTIGDDQLKATVISFGACLKDLRLKNFDYPLVLGFKDIEDYITNAAYLGAVVGRNANRIAHGQCVLEGQPLSFTMGANDQHQLHGGPQGSSFRNWQLVSETTNQIVLQDNLPHGHMGFPGNLAVQITYTVEHNVLDVKIEASTDQTTLCNFALHNYFNLDNSLNLSHHILTVGAATYLPTDLTGIPMGHETLVAHTEFDYRHGKCLENICINSSLDHNFCIANKAGVERPSAHLKSRSSGVSLELFSTEVGLQIYDAAHVDVLAHKTLHRRRYGPCSGLAMEPQGWPNAANESAFPSTILYPSELYSQTTRYQFDTFIV